IFSGNQTSASSAYGGAIYNDGTMTVKGCTFYNNSAINNGYGGAIYTTGTGSTLTLCGNLFYRNTVGRALYGPVVYRNNGTVTSLGYNVSDETLLTNPQNGYIAAFGDKQINNNLPISLITFKLLSGSEAANIITTLPDWYPDLDFYGNSILESAAAGAVQAEASGTGFFLDLSVNYANRGTVSVSRTPNEDGLYPTPVTLTATAKDSFEFWYWLVDGQRRDSEHIITLNENTHILVRAVFSRIVMIDNYGIGNTEGTLQYALINALDDDIICISEEGQSIALISRLEINKNITIKGNGVTITRASAWTATGTGTQLLNVANGTTVTIDRIYFKDGRATDYGAAIDNRGNLTLESCIFSGNKTINNDAFGGAIYNGGIMNIKGCTFHENGFTDSAGTTGFGGAIYNTGTNSTLTLIGNLFYENTAGTATRGPVIFQSGGTVTSLGYNVVDVAMGTDDGQSGFTETTGDIRICTVLLPPPISRLSFKLLSGSKAASIIPANLLADYPTKDFYGDPINAPAAAGAVQTVAPGFYFGVTANSNNRGNFNITDTPEPDADGLFSFDSSVTITAEPNQSYAVYWLVNKQDAGLENPLSLTITEHTIVQVVFTCTFIVDDFTDTNNAATRAGTFRHALANVLDYDVVRFDGVESGESVVELTNILPQITKIINIEGNGITITRSSSWDMTSDTSQLLRTDARTTITISRIHFKDGRATDYGAAIDNRGNMTLESCIFSGNQTTANNAYGGAIYNNGTMNVKGCTFYGNGFSDNPDSSGYGGSIYITGTDSRLTLIGNLFYGNTAGTIARGHVVFRDNGIVTSLGYNLVDVDLGDTNNQSGFAANDTDEILETLLDEDTISPFVDADGDNFMPISDILAIIDVLPENFPILDFFGNMRTFPGTPGAVVIEP
ncbi:MAG: hypothetical protein FWD36_02565, partial [Treponema sp.]|nr:hypothetical protein [Treponema sp.]